MRVMNRADNTSDKNPTTMTMKGISAQEEVDVRGGDQPKEAQKTEGGLLHLHLLRVRRRSGREREGR